MQQTADNGGTILMHAENGMAIDVVAARPVAAGKTDPYYHGVVRYPIFEGEATNRVIRLAEAADVPVYIVHLSARDALDASARRATAAPWRSPRRARSTCSSRSTTWATASRAPSSSARRRCAPPTTRPSSGRAWSRTTSRSSRPTTARSTSTARSSWAEGDFRKVPNGLPGVEDRLDLMHDGGVVAGRLTRERWVEVCSAAPARMFGLAGRKGVVAPGADADLVVYDPARTHTISAATHHMDVDYSCYEGRQVTGRLRRRAVARQGHHRERRVYGQQGRRPLPEASHRAVIPRIGDRPCS